MTMIPPRFLSFLMMPGLLAAQPAQDTSLIHEVETRLPKLMAKHHVPGAAVVRIEDRRIAWAKYLGVREAGKEAPVDAATVFEAASMTKPLAAYAALKLVEQGFLDLDRPLASYLSQPYLRDQPLHLKITARMVLNHTSGFPNWRGAQGLKVLHEPGTRHGYSGEGFQLLQLVLTQITGRPYESLMQEMLLRPLGMTSSSHVWAEHFASCVAAGHDDQGRVKTDRKLYHRPNAAYSLYCTPRDYAAFVIEMLKSDRKAAHSVGAASLRAMLTPSGPPVGNVAMRGDIQPRFGLGWCLESAGSATEQRVFHSGSNGTGFRSLVEFEPQRGHGLVIMTNSTRGGELCRELLRLQVPVSALRKRGP